jgi:methyl-accepting chemotaxis protein
LIIGLFFVFFVINYFVGFITKPLSEVSKHLGSLSLGRVEEEEIDYSIDDEIGKIISSTKILKENTKELIEQAELIAQGDYSKFIEIRSDDDRLSKSLNNMIKILKENEELNQHREWFANGIRKINSSLSGNLERDIPKMLCPYCNIIFKPPLHKI